MRCRSLPSVTVLGLVVGSPGWAQMTAPAASAAPPPVTAFVDVSVVPMDRERVLAHQTVVVREGHIVALGPVRQVRVPAAAVRIDGQGKFLIPGLADMHVHVLSMDSARIADQLFTYVANGVTTIRDMHAGGRGPRHWVKAPQSDLQGLRLKRGLARGEVVGPRLYTAGDPDQTSPEAAAKSVAELKADGHDFVKISLDGRWPAPQPLYDSVLAAARRVGLPVVGHVPQGFDVTQLAAPWVSAEHLYEYTEYVLGLAGRWSRTDGGMVMTMRRDIADTAPWMQPNYRLDPGRLRRLTTTFKRAGIWTCPTLSILLSVRTGVGGAWSQSHLPGADTSATFAPVVGKRYLEFDFQILKALQDAGAGLLLGTDVPSPYAIHGELAGLVEAGLTPYQALATGTRNVAQFLGVLDRSGTVAVGKRADLVLLSGNPLLDIGYTAGPAGVMVGGRWLPRGELEAKLTVLDERLGYLKDRQHFWQH